MSRIMPLLLFLTSAAALSQEPAAPDPATPLQQATTPSQAAERQRLMDEHMRAMREGMSMMNQVMMRGGLMGGAGSAGPGAECAAGDTGCRMRGMESQQRTMGQRVDMMQMMMMMQMLGRMDEQSAAGSHAEPTPR